MKNKIEDILIELGITPNLKGFHYICKSIEIILNNQYCSIKIYDGLYVEVGNYFNTKNTKVERDIRYCLKKNER